MKPWEKRQAEEPEVQRQGTPWQRRQATQFTIRTPTTPESVTAELETRGPVERFMGGVGASAAETYYGAKELAGQAAAEQISEATGEPVSALSPEEQQRLEEWQAIRGGAATAGRVTGDIVQTALPAARAYQLVRMDDAP